MCILGLIFSLLGFYGLLMLVNVEVFRFMPVSSGAEGGMIDGAIGFVFGGIATLLALAFAILHFRRAQNIKGPRLLLAWCSLVLIGFVVLLIHMVLNYRHAQSSS